MAAIQLCPNLKSTCTVPGEFCVVWASADLVSVDKQLVSFLIEPSLPTGRSFAIMRLMTCSFPSGRPRRPPPTSPIPMIPTLPLRLRGSYIRFYPLLRAGGGAVTVNNPNDHFARSGAGLGDSTPAYTLHGSGRHQVP